MATISLKKGDRLPKLRATLTDSDGAALNLSGASVVFRMRLRFSATALKVNAAATIIDAAAGVVEYSWGATDTDTEGAFDGEFAVTLGGLLETVPGSGSVLVVIEPILS